MRRTSVGSVAVAFAAAALAACGCDIGTSMLLTEMPPPERLASLPPWARDGVPCRLYHVGGKVRATLPAFVGSRAEAQSVGHADALASLIYAPEGALVGTTPTPTVRFAVYASGGRKDVVPATFWSGGLDWARGLVPELTQERLAAARAASAGRALKGRFAGADCWARLAVVTRDRLYRVFEVYLTKPEGASPPDFVATHSVWDGEKKAWVSPTGDAEMVLQIGAKLYKFSSVEIAPDGTARAFAMDEWRPSFDDVVAVRVNFLSGIMGQTKAVAYLNGFLLEWKTRDMRDRLRAAPVSELEGMVVALEKAVLTYDLQSKRVKDAAQAKLAGGGDPAAQLEIARLFEQRIDILASILATTKQVLSAKRRAR